jgi:uncharacterized RDD family membrane protein YckC
MAPGGVRFAGFWIRFVAWFVDILITGIPMGIVIGATGAVQCTSAITTTDSLGTYTTAPVCTFNPAVELFSVLVGLIYFAAMWSTGATVGQRLLGLRVVDAASGANIGLVRAFVRYVGYIIASIPLALGLIWAGFDLRKQGWHDKIANTLVVHR